MRYGADVLVADPAQAGSGRRLGMITSDAARLATDPRRTSRSALLSAGVPIVRLFAPEHGLTAAAPDGAAVADSTDEVTGLPITSLYGERTAPQPGSLNDLDGLLVDLPDVGARFYTYVWTMTDAIDACAEAGLPIVVLDRPNPLGGDLESAEGPLLEESSASFLGRHSIPVRHSLTVGELALLWRAERRPHADVRVVVCDGWYREPWHRTSRPFVPTSPAIRTVDAVLLYPGLCLLEATNVSVGRGSPLSFTAAGAPWLDATAVSAAFNARGAPGLRAHADAFVPGSGPHAGERCAAVRLHVLEPDSVRSVAAGLMLLTDIAARHPQRLTFEPYPTAANPSGANHLERLLGSAAIARTVMAAPDRITADDIADWTATPHWPARWRSALLYP